MSKNKLKNDKPKKERASKYDKPLKINGTFEQVIKALVKEPIPDYKPKAIKGLSDQDLIMKYESGKINMKKIMKSLLKTKSPKA